MVEISKSGSGEGLGGVIPRGYSKRPCGGGAVWPALLVTRRRSHTTRDAVEGPSHIQDEISRGELAGLQPGLGLPRFRGRVRTWVSSTLRQLSPLVVDG